MYVATVPNRTSPPAILLREGYREGGRVKTRTLANLTHWPAARVEALRRCLKGEFDGWAADASPVNDRVYGLLYVLRELAQRLGLSQALGRDRRAKLALLLVLARVAHQGSRLSVVRWARGQAVPEVLGLEAFDEDDLYETLTWLSERQAEIETRLYRSYLKRRQGPPALVLYDVTSSYLEGQCNALAEYGYNRDGKRGKKQIVIGLLCDDQGEPLAVRVFRGNTSDPATLAEPIAALRDQFGITEVVFVGDRGMVKAKGQAQLQAESWRYISALTHPQIRALLRRDVIQLDLFDELAVDVTTETQRLVLRRNPAVVAKEAHRRHDKLERLRQRVAERNEQVAHSRRADPQSGLRSLQSWLTRHRLHSFVTLRLNGRMLEFDIDQDALGEHAALDGCYALCTDLPAETMSAATVDARYRDLTRVERDFRAMKTGMLEVRPIFLQKAARTQGHVLVTMLALKLYRQLDQCLTAAMGTTDDNRYALTADDALDALSRMCFRRCSIAGQTLLTLPHPDLTQQRIFNALDLRYPPTTHRPADCAALADAS